MIKSIPEINDFIKFCQLCEEAILQNYGDLNKTSLVNLILNSKILKNNQMNLGILQIISTKSKSKSISKMHTINDKKEDNLFWNQTKITKDLIKYNISYYRICEDSSINYFEAFSFNYFHFLIENSKLSILLKKLQELLKVNSSSNETDIYNIGSRRQEANLLYKVLDSIFNIKSISSQLFALYICFNYYPDFAFSSGILLLHWAKNFSSMYGISGIETFKNDHENYSNNQILAFSKFLNKNDMAEVIVLPFVLRINFRNYILDTQASRTRIYTLKSDISYYKMDIKDNLNFQEKNIEIGKISDRQVLFFKLDLIDKMPDLQKLELIIDYISSASSDDLQFIENQVSSSNNIISERSALEHEKKLNLGLKFNGVKLPCEKLEMEKEEFIKETIMYNSIHSDAFIDSDLNSFFCYKCGSKLHFSVLNNQFSEKEISDISDKIISEIEARHNNALSEKETKKETPYELPSNQVYGDLKSDPSQKLKSSSDEVIKRNLMPNNVTNLNNINESNNSNLNSNLNLNLNSKIQSEIPINAKSIENLDSKNANQIFYGKDTIQIEGVHNLNHINDKLHKKVIYSPLEEIDQKKDIKSLDFQIAESKIDNGLQDERINKIGNINLDLFKSKKAIAENVEPNNLNSNYPREEDKGVDLNSNINEPFSTYNKNQKSKEMMYKRTIKLPCESTEIEISYFIRKVIEYNLANPNLQKGRNLSESKSNSVKCFMCGKDLPFDFLQAHLNYEELEKINEILENSPQKKNNKSSMQKQNYPEKFKDTEEIIPKVEIKKSVPHDQGYNESNSSEKLVRVHCMNDKIPLDNYTNGIIQYNVKYPKITIGSNYFKLACYLCGEEILCSSLKDYISDSQLMNILDRIKLGFKEINQEKDATGNYQFELNDKFKFISQVNETKENQIKKREIIFEESKKYSPENSGKINSDSSKLVKNMLNENNPYEQDNSRITKQDTIDLHSELEEVNKKYNGNKAIKIRKENENRENQTIMESNNFIIQFSIKKPVLFEKSFQYNSYSLISSNFKSDTVINPHINIHIFNFNFNFNFNGIEKKELFLDKLIRVNSRNPEYSQERLFYFVLCPECNVCFSKSDLQKCFTKDDIEKLFKAIQSSYNLLHPQSEGNKAIELHEQNASENAQHYLNQYSVKIQEIKVNLNHYSRDPTFSTQIFHCKKNITNFENIVELLVNNNLKNYTIKDNNHCIYLKCCFCENILYNYELKKYLTHFQIEEIKRKIIKESQLTFNRFQYHDDENKKGLTNLSLNNNYFDNIKKYNSKSFHCIPNIENLSKFKQDILKINQDDPSFFQKNLGFYIKCPGCFQQVNISLLNPIFDQFDLDDLKKSLGSIKESREINFHNYKLPSIQENENHKNIIQASTSFNMNSSNIIFFHCTKTGDSKSSLRDKIIDFNTKGNIKINFNEKICCHLCQMPINPESLKEFFSLDDCLLIQNIVAGYRKRMENYYNFKNSFAFKTKRSSNY